MNFTRHFCASAMLLCLLLTQARCQQRTYSVSNAHAHNDYIHPLPFYTAYNAGFGSIEADVFLQEGQLLVAHTQRDVAREKTLQTLYLDPLQKEIQKNGGHVYSDSAKRLSLLIDLKTAAEPTLETLVQVLQQYKTLTDCRELKIVVTGNRPDISKFATYPAFIYFDGEITKTYAADALARVALFSHDFRKLTSWNGTTVLTEGDQKNIEAAVSKAHAANKPVRFWAAPDMPAAWSLLMKLGVDYINTDKISEIAAYLKK